MLRHLMLSLHLLAAIAWLGGMFFAYFCLRPAATELLAPPQRLPLWVATFARILRYAAIAVGVVLASGLTMLAQTGIAGAPWGWHLMAALGLVMAAVFAYVYLGLYPRLRAACDASDWPAAGVALNGIRRLVALNLALGLCAVLAAVSAR